MAAVTQFYHGLPYPNGQTYFGGTQDNGTNRGTDVTGPNAAYPHQRRRRRIRCSKSRHQHDILRDDGLSLRRSTNGGASSFSDYWNHRRRVPVHHGLQNGSNNADAFVDWWPFHVAHRQQRHELTRTSNAQQTGGSITAMAISPAELKRSHKRRRLRTASSHDRGTDCQRSDSGLQHGYRRSRRAVTATARSHGSNTIPECERLGHNLELQRHTERQRHQRRSRVQKHGRRRNVDTRRRNADTRKRECHSGHSGAQRRYRSE